MSATLPSRPWATDGTFNSDVADLTNPSSISRIPSPLSSNVPHGSLVERASLSHIDRRSLRSSVVSKPLRSSPLAGPALQADGAASEVKDEPKLKPPRIASTPNLASLLATPPLSKRARPRTTESAQGIPSFLVHQSSSLETLTCTPSRHVHSGNEAKQANEVLGRSAPSAHLSHQSSTPALCPRSLPKEPGTEKGNRPSSIIRRPNTAHGYPTAPSPPAVSCRHSTDHASSAQSRELRNNSWLVANPYETTPKFSRLGLASAGVVLPMSAKEHKRLTHQNSRLSVKTSTARIARAGSSNSSPDASPTLSFQQETLSLPTTSMMQNGSLLSSASESLAAQSLREDSAVPMSATSSTITTITEGEEYVLRYDSTSKPNDHSRSVPPTTTSKQGPFGRLKGMTLRSIRSSASLSKSRSSPVSGKLTMDKRRSQSEIRLGFFTSRAVSPTASESTADSKPTEVGELPLPHPRTERSVRKFWKSLGLWHRSRSQA
ncbi:hypothetical protein NP233_g9945 [Leucocoprinus birnbaumii]|uniref:Uncharacterized protein n=1 Tax=Leucocoprinus birnbaumii TaxID=56174 RepID=A0AAD5VJ91_9AGAR|nr:hypothetical protein NP233_g9945 [Leucocoprinus birnbaumii]